jgi:hypothetical protein
MLKAFMIASIALISLGGLLLIPSPSQAQPKFLTRLIRQYPHLADTELNGCLVCHDKGVGGGATNAFAEAYFDNGFSFSNIEDFDSDEDGFTNLEELMAGTFPGDANSTPPTVETSPTETPAALPTSSLTPAQQTSEQLSLPGEPPTALPSPGPTPPPTQLAVAAPLPEATPVSPTSTRSPTSVPPTQPVVSGHLSPAVVVSPAIQEPVTSLATRFFYLGFLTVGLIFAGLVLKRYLVSEK